MRENVATWEIRSTWLIIKVVVLIRLGYIQHVGITCRHLTELDMSSIINGNEVLYLKICKGFSARLNFKDFNSQFQFLFILLIIEHQHQVATQPERSRTLPQWMMEGTGRRDPNQQVP